MATIKSLSRATVSTICSSCRQRLIPTISQRRTFTNTSQSNADTSSSSSGNSSGLGGLSELLNTQTATSNRRTSSSPNNDPSTPSRIGRALDTPSFLTDEFTRNLNLHADQSLALPHRLHVYAHKHNTHLTFVQPPRRAAETASSSVSNTSASAAEQNKVIDVLMSLSTGQIGFRKAGRGSFDAAYQLTAFVFKQIQEKGMLKDIHKLEVVLRGFGAGREAVVKALMGAEGRRIRGKVSAVVDATRLKQGGPRSKKPRRLG